MPRYESTSRNAATVSAESGKGDEQHIVYLKTRQRARNKESDTRPHQPPAFHAGNAHSESMAAVGAVGILTWMSGSIALLNKVGAEVSVGQSIGARSEEDARSFASHNITIALLISVCWGGLLFLFARPILNIFELKQHITDAAVTYLRIVSTGLPFIFLSAASEVSPLSFR